MYNLGEALSRVSVLTAGSDFIDDSITPELMDMTSSAIQLLISSDMEEADVRVAAGIQCIARVAQRTTVGTKSRAAEVVMEAASSFAKNMSVQEATLSAIGPLVDDPEAVSVLAERGAVATLRESRRTFAGNDVAEKAASESLKKLTDTVRGGSYPLHLVSTYCFLSSMPSLSPCN